MNHPPKTPDNKDDCVASDTSDASKVTIPTPLFHVFNAFLWCTDLFGEETHKDHHEYPRRALRPTYKVGFPLLSCRPSPSLTSPHLTSPLPCKVDFPYLLFIYPLERSGLIWKLQAK